MTEGEDFYINEAGLMVLTEKFLLKRGICCNNDCVHCPYKKALPNQIESQKSGLL